MRVTLLHCTRRALPIFKGQHATLSTRRQRRQLKKNNNNDDVVFGSEQPGSNTSSSKTSTFHDLVESGNIDQVKVFVATKSPSIINTGDPGRAGTTPLHLASRRGFLELTEYFCHNGADVNARGAWNLTPLMYSAIFNHSSVATCLLKHGADPTLVDAKGNTAYAHAILEKNYDVSNILTQEDKIE